MAGTTASATVLTMRSGGAGGVDLAYNTTAWAATSDETLKDIVGNIESATESLKRTRSVRFTWKDDDSKRVNLGVIAQDIQKEYPEAVEENEDTGILSVRYTELIPVLIAGFNESEKRISKLERK